MPPRIVGYISVRLDVFFCISECAHASASFAMGRHPWIYNSCGKYQFEIQRLVSLAKRIPNLMFLSHAAVWPLPFFSSDLCEAGINASYARISSWGAPPFFPRSFPDTLVFFSLPLFLHPVLPEKRLG